MKVGDELTFTKRVTEDQPMRYGEASGDLNPIHTDDAFARSVGLDGVILQGLCTMSFLHQAAVTWAGGDPMAVETLETRFTSPVYPGDEVRFEGTVVERDGDRAHIEVTGFNQDDEAVLDDAVARVEIETERR